MFSWLFPPRCAACREFTASSHSLCSACNIRWPRLASAVFEGPTVRVFAAGRYEGILLDLIVRLKYRKEERLARPLSECLIERCGEELKGRHDVILPVPIHLRRLRERGFNQSVLIARRVGRSLDLSMDAWTLNKTRETPPQAGLSRDKRLKNLKGAFAMRRPEAVRGKRVLIVDDVYTTGATIETAAKTLLKAGADSVEGLVLARSI